MDFSAVALRLAAEAADRRGLAAEYRTGDLTATGLATESVRAVLCVDSIQFAEPTAGALAETARVLAPGGRVVLTGWEAVRRGDPRVLERLRHLDLGAGLRAAGFHDVQVQHRPYWQAAERGLLVEAAARDPGEDPALRSFHEEAHRSLTTFDDVRRVLASGTWPPAG